MAFTPFQFADHNHATCQQDAMEAAAAQCARRGVRLTESRRKVLRILWDHHSPVSAYEILARLNAQMRANHPGARPLAPPVVYRALDFLIANGLAHKLNRLSAYVGCAHPGQCHAAQFYICRSCQEVVELHDPVIGREIERAAQELGFTVQTPVVEVEGLCSRCHTAVGGGKEHSYAEKAHL